MNSYKNIVSNTDEIYYLLEGFKKGKTQVLQLRNGLLQS